MQVSVSVVLAASFFIGSSLSLASCSDDYAHVEAKSASFPAWLLAGPMLGHVSASEVRVWFQEKPGAGVRGELRLLSAALQSGKAELQSEKAELQSEKKDKQGQPRAPDEDQDLGDGCHVLVFSGLPASRRFRVALHPEGQHSGGAASKQAAASARQVEARTAAKPSDHGKLVLAFGSCSRDSEYGRAPIFKRIPEQHPDMMIFAGDNSYFVRGGKGPTRFSTTTKHGDWDSHDKMLARHLQTRRLPELQKILQTMPCYAIWDDHDYGPNDADASFAGKQDALRAFRQVWANPPRPEGAAEGTYTSFRRGPVEFWLMDDRWYKRTKDKNKKLLKNATIWGAAQLAWLEKGLAASTAPLKIIVNGTQIFERGFVGEGHWQEAKQERKRLEDFLRTQRIDGLLVLSGDRHHHELMHVGPVDGAWIYEFTSAPLQYGQKVGPIPKERSNPTRIWGSRGNGFGLLTVDIKAPGEGSLRFELFAENGKTPDCETGPCASTIQLKDLYYDPR